MCMSGFIVQLTTLGLLKVSLLSICIMWVWVTSQDLPVLNGVSLEGTYEFPLSSLSIYTYFLREIFVLLRVLITFAADTVYSFA